MLDHIADACLAAIAPHVGWAVMAIILVCIVLAGIAAASAWPTDDEVIESANLGNGAFDPDLTRDFDAEESMRETRH
jgi:hypothetical protein